jgi:hypothetical protein
MAATSIAFCASRISCRWEHDRRLFDGSKRSEDRVLTSVLF